MGCALVAMLTEVCAQHVKEFGVLLKPHLPDCQPSLETIVKATPMFLSFHSLMKASSSTPDYTWLSLFSSFRIWVVANVDANVGVVVASGAGVWVVANVDANVVGVMVASGAGMVPDSTW